MRMSKRVVICVPDAYVDMVDQFMSAQACKGLSFSVLVAMAMKSYGANDIIGPALMGSGLSPISASHLSSFSSDVISPKRKRGRPKKSETSSVSERSVPVSERSVAEGEPKNRVAKPKEEPVVVSAMEAEGLSEIPQEQDMKADVPDRVEVSKESSTARGSERSGWSEDAFDGLDPDFNPDGGLDNVFELLGGNR